MGPSVKTVPQSNNATPLSQDFLKMLQGQMDQGAFGTGVGPLQREAGTNARQLVSSLAGQKDVNTAGSLADYTGKLTSAVTASSKANTEDSSAALRQKFGIGGNRFSSASARGDAKLRSNEDMNLNTLVAGILTDQGTREQGAREFDVNANQNKNTQFMQAIQGLFGMGENNTRPFEDLTKQGVVNPETIASPGIGSQLLSSGFDILGKYLSGGGSFGIKGGGSLPKTPGDISGALHGATPGGYSFDPSKSNPFQPRL